MLNNVCAHNVVRHACRQSEPLLPRGSSNSRRGTITQGDTDQAAVTWSAMGRIRVVLGHPLIYHLKLTILEFIHLKNVLLNKNELSLLFDNRKSLL